MVVHKIVVNIENDRDLRLLANRGDRFENFRRSRARLQPALGGQLVHEAVRERIAERHAEFQDIDPQFVEAERKLARRFEIGVAGANVDDEPLLPFAAKAGKAFIDPIHARGLFVFRGASFKRQNRQSQT